MITGRIPEITIKFTERPDLPTEGKKVILEIQGENNVTVKAEVNRKTLKKQVAKMDEYEELTFHGIFFSIKRSLNHRFPKAYFPVIDCH